MLHAKNLLFFDVIKMLLASGASVDRPTRQRNIEVGVTALMYACSCGDSKIVQVILVVQNLQEHKARNQPTFVWCILW